MRVCEVGWGGVESSRVEWCGVGWNGVERGGAEWGGVGSGWGGGWGGWGGVEIKIIISSDTLSHAHSHSRSHNIGKILDGEQLAQPKQTSASS